MGLARLSGASWSSVRQVAAKVKFDAEGLFRHVGFIASRLPMPSQAAVPFLCGTYSVRNTDTYGLL